MNGLIPTLLLLGLTGQVSLAVQSCKPAQVWARGRDILAALNGQVVLVAFARDGTALDSLSSLAGHHPQVRIVALLDPSSTTAEDVQRLSDAHRRLIVDKDDHDGRRRLNLQLGDAALFDRCSRLARTLSLTDSAGLQSALKSAAHHASCGWCQYSGGGSGPDANKMDAYLEQVAPGGGRSPPLANGGPRNGNGKQLVYVLPPHNSHQQRQPQYNHQSQQQQQPQHHQVHHQQAQQQPHHNHHQRSQHQLQNGPNDPYRQRVHQQHQTSQQQSRQFQTSQAGAQSAPAYPQHPDYRTPSPQRAGQGQRHQQHEHHQQQQQEQRQWRQHVHPTTRPIDYNMMMNPNAPPPSFSSSSLTSSGGPSSPPRKFTTEMPDTEYSDYFDGPSDSMTPTTKMAEVNTDPRRPEFNDDAMWQTAAPVHQRQDFRDGGAQGQRGEEERFQAARPYKDLFASPASDPSVSSTSSMSDKVFTTEATKGFEPGAMRSAASPRSVSQRGEPSQDYGSRQGYGSGSAAQTYRNPNPESADDDEVNVVEIPCHAVTDEICYHQRKSGSRIAAKCCKKGIYLADFCVPGRCSNATMQACCMQKYLQARYQCCESPDMEGTTATDSFSRCCHSHFVTHFTLPKPTIIPRIGKVDAPPPVEQDDCCPPAVASEYWQSVHDICLPNIDVDLKHIKLELRLSDGIKIMDLKENQSWNHTCRYGTNRAQFVYVP